MTSEKKYGHRQKQAGKAIRKAHSGLRMATKKTPVSLTKRKNRGTPRIVKPRRSGGRQAEKDHASLQALVLIRISILPTR